jgi:hypothetical protein
MDKQIKEHQGVTFLKSLFKNCKEGYINLRFLPSGVNKFIPLSEINNIPAILEANKYQNAFFGVATRENGDATKQGIDEIPALWIDSDFKGKDLDETEKMLQTILDFPLKYTYVVQSNGGLHIDWRLKEPLKREDIPRVEKRLKRLAAALGGDLAATDASRILRIPGTRNYKYDPAKEVILIEENSDEYNLSDFDFLPPVETPIEGEPTEHQEDWEKELLDGVEEGQRSISITRLAGRYLSKGLSREEILPILCDVNSRNEPPLDEEEVETTLDSIIKTHQRSLPERVEYKKEEKGHRINYRLTTLGEVLEYPEPTYLIDTILIEGTVSVLGAYTGVGKSITALSIIKSILTGDPLWGKYRVIKTGSVLLVDEETPKSFLRERTEKMNFGKTLPLYFLHFQDVRLDRDDCFNALMEKIEEVKPVFLVIDSLIRVHRQKEDDAVSMALVIARLRKIVNSGTTVLIIHHHKKGDGPLNQKLRGSSDIPGGVDIEYALIPKDDFLLFSSVKTRTKPLPPIRLKMTADDDKIEVTYQGEEIGEKAEILNEVLIILGRGKMGVEEIHKALKERTLEIGINKLREILKEAKGKQLTEDKGVRGKKLYGVASHFSRPYIKE